MQLRKHDFPSPVDTSTKPITQQQPRSWGSPNGLVITDNKFLGARASKVEWVTNDSLLVYVKPENTPINPSPWYAFRLVANKVEAQELKITLDYGDAYHRYFPKLSSNGRDWVPIDSSNLVLGSDTTFAHITVKMNSDTLWVAGQELWASDRVNEWVDGITTKFESVRKSLIGKSKLGRDLIALEISSGEVKRKPAIVLLSRQHPPEVTGFLAHQAFVEELLNSDLSENFLSRYRILVYPMVNPDGVDLGHWRHNAGGIDLNRDWAYYRQPEVAAVSTHIVNTLAAGKNELQLGIDFHSTWKDVYYTPDGSVPLLRRQDFRAKWHHRIEEMVGEGFKVNNDPTPIGKPTSAGWVAVQFGAPGITYEVGDSTPRDFIVEKARASARAMMELLLID